MVGEIELIPYYDVVILCNKAQKNLKPNIYITKEFLNIGETIRGNIIITCKENNNFKTLSKEQVIKYTKFLKNASFHYNNIDENGRFILPNTTNILRNIAKDKTLDDTAEKPNSQNEEILKMILGIQTVILKYIKNNIN
mgnify:FL=1